MSITTHPRAGNAARLIVRPEDVDEMAKGMQPESPLTELWELVNKRDPIAEARVCLRNRKRRTTSSILLAVVTIILVIAAGWLVAGSDLAKQSATLPKEAFISVVLGVAALMSAAEVYMQFSSRDDMARDFAYKPGEFGHDIAAMSEFLGSTGNGKPCVMTFGHGFDVYERTTLRLKEEARLFQEAEKKHLAKFAGSRFKPGKSEYVSDARERFSQLFELAKRFGMTDPRGWDSYFPTEQGGETIA